VLKLLGESLPPFKSHKLISAVARGKYLTYAKKKLVVDACEFENHKVGLLDISDYKPLFCDKHSVLLCDTGAMFYSLF
jgi:hypothetical protein